MKRLLSTFSRCVPLASVCLVAAATHAAEPERIPLWAIGAPGEPATKAEDEPAIFLHRPAPDVANGTAVVICPGGGYGHLAIDHEGHQIADWLNTLGVTAFVLKYRHNASGHQHPVPMMDGRSPPAATRER